MKIFHSPFAHHRARRQRLRAVAMDRARAFGDNEHIGAHVFEQFAMRGRFLEFGLGVSLDQEDRMPAADERETVAIEDRAELRRLARKLVAELHAFEARRLRFGQALLERESSRRSPACRHWTSRSDWRRCGSCHAPSLINRLAVFVTPAKAGTHGSAGTALGMLVTR